MSHYNEDYFHNYQKNIGLFGGKANLFKFQPYIKPGQRVLDYGCGGGYLMENLECGAIVGYDINPSSLDEARSRGLEVYENFDLIPGQFDVVVSNHTLEHVPDPAHELRKIATKLHAGGITVFVVPYENQDQAWNPDDVNKHLYTWSPLNLGNLFTYLGYEVLECGILHHTWPPNYLEIVQAEGWDVFHQKCREYSEQTNIKQVKAVCRFNPS